MTQTGTYASIEHDDEELEIQKEMSSMVRPAMDFSSASVSKQETLSWAQQVLSEQKEMDDLPMTVLRPKIDENPQMMRGWTDQVGKDLNSEPGVERVMMVPDDQTIRSSEASTARLRRESNYEPTDAESIASTVTKPVRKIDMSCPTTTSTCPDPYQPSTSSEGTIQPTQNVEKETSFDELMENISTNLFRTSGTFNGVYFPCFGILVAPLFGTEIFPLPPKQEKFHFNLVMNEPTDHYDGNPNSKYEDEVRTWMKKQIFAFGKTSISFNAMRMLDENQELWAQKFPLSTVRWGETVSAFTLANFNSREGFQPIEAYPTLFDNKTDLSRVALGTVTARRTVTGLHNMPQPIQSKDKLLSKKQQLEADKLKVFIGETDFRQTTTMEAYDEYAKVVKHFRVKGHTFKSPTNHIKKVSELIRDVTTVNDMQKWLVFTQGKTDFNVYHDGWTETPIMKKRLSHTDKARISSFMLTCLEYHNFVQIRDKVSWNYFHKLT